MIYICSPYSTPVKEDQDAAMVERYKQVLKYAAHLTTQGIVGFSPIAYYHPMAESFEMPRTYYHWRDINHSLIDSSNKVHVFMLEGWRESKGVQGEIVYASSIGKPILYIDPVTYKASLNDT